MDVTARGARNPNKVAQAAARAKPTKDKFNVFFNAFVARTRYYARRRWFFYRDPETDEILQFTKDDLREFLTGEGFFKKFAHLAGGSNGSKTAKAKAEKALATHRWLRFTHAVTKKNPVDWAGEIAGYPCPGPYLFNGHRCLLLRGPKMIQPKKGPHKYVRRIVEELYPDGQSDFYLTRLKHFLQNFEHPEETLMAQVLITAGNTGDGKTLLCRHITTPILGGRQADATSYLVGDTRFNGDLGRAEHWVVDDQGDALHFDRLVYTNALKKIAADPMVRIEEKGMRAIHAPIKCLVSVLLNTEGRNLALLPELTNDVQGKLIILKSSKVELKESDAEKERLIREQLPGFVYWLRNEYRPPKEILTDERFGIIPFHHPEIVELMQETGNATHLFNVVQQKIELDQKAEWEETAAGIYQELLSDQATRNIVEKLCRSVNRFGQLLNQLTISHPQYVTGKKTEKGKVYSIKRVSKTVQKSPAIQLS